MRHKALKRCIDDKQLSKLIFTTLELPYDPTTCSIDFTLINPEYEYLGYDDVKVKGTCCIRINIGMKYATKYVMAIDSSNKKHLFGKVVVNGKKCGDVVFYRQNLIDEMVRQFINATNKEYSICIVDYEYKLLWPKWASSYEALAVHFDLA